MSLALSPDSPLRPPRIGPVLEGHSDTAGIREAARELGINLWPSQDYALEIAHERGPDAWKYREIAIIQSRRNGKTKILLPLIRSRLKKGRRIIHTAQNRLLPRRVFVEVAKSFPDARIRYANGQEEIELSNGGRYIIVAPQRGARGEDADDLIVDELREMEDFDFIAAAEPTIASAEDPQVFYLSNAGTELSVVLNDLRNRAGSPGLAYMEWSAAPEREVDDREGWLEANPSIGYGNLTLERLQALFDRYRGAGELSVFETEHLCRWVKSMLPRLVPDVVWQTARAPLELPVRPALGVSVHPGGTRASAVLSWAQSDGSIGLRVEADVTGDPINLSRFAEDLTKRLEGLGVVAVGYDSWTDQHLARHFPDAEAIVGPAFANASERFVRALETGGLHWQAADAISDQLPYVSRKGTTGTAWVAEPTDRNRPVTAVLAAVRSVWLASNPRVLTPRVF